MINCRNLSNYLVHYDRFIVLIKLAFPALVYMLKTLEGKVINPYLYYIEHESINRNIKSKSDFDLIFIKGMN